MKQARYGILHLYLVQMQTDDSLSSALQEVKSQDNSGNQATLRAFYCVPDTSSSS